MKQSSKSPKFTLIIVIIIVLAVMFSAWPETKRDRLLTSLAGFLKGCEVSDIACQEDNAGLADPHERKLESDSWQTPVRSWSLEENDRRNRRFGNSDLDRVVPEMIKDSREKNWRSFKPPGKYVADEERIARQILDNMDRILKENHENRKLSE